MARLARFSSGAHAEVYRALQEERKKGAKAFVLDLRDNGGGLVSEAQLVASAFLEDGPIVTTRGRAVPERTLRATGSPVVPKAPLVVLVNDGTASASEIVTGALEDRDRAKVVGSETFGKGVFQQVLKPPNGGVLDITAGQYFTPDGRNLGGRGVQTGKGIVPDVPAKDVPAMPADEGLDKAVRRRPRLPGRPGRGGGRGGGRRDGPPGAPAGEPLVVLLEAHGRFLTGEPVFGPGRRVTVERGRDARPGHLALLRPARGGVGRARVERLLGRPDVARDVLEAYLLHRGCAAGSRRASSGPRARPSSGRTGRPQPRARRAATSGPCRR